MTRPNRRFACGYILVLAVFFFLALSPTPGAGQTGSPPMPPE